MHSTKHVIYTCFILNVYIPRDGFWCLVPLSFGESFENSFLSFLEDVKRLSEKLKESNATKGDLQLKLDELQASDVSVKASNKKFLMHKMQFLPKAN